MIEILCWIALGAALAVIAERARFRAWDTHQRIERRLLVTQRQHHQRGQS